MSVRLNFDLGAVRSKIGEGQVGQIDLTLLLTRCPRGELKASFGSVRIRLKVRSHLQERLAHGGFTILDRRILVESSQTRTCVLN
jgi:hypothetical protein